MEWFDKFKVGQKVRVIKKVDSWRFDGKRGADWVENMNQTIGKCYEVVFVDTHIGYRLHTQIPIGWYDEKYDYWYPVESLGDVNAKGQQLLFDFMW